MADLPLLLAGPIIRRAEPEGVWIWIATRDEVSKVSPSITAYNKDGSPNLSHGSNGLILLAQLGPASFRCLRLGERLWVSLFRMSAKRGKLPAGAVLGYDFSIETADGVATLAELVDDFAKSLCYAPYPTPTFYLQRENGRLAQGLCRRPGAFGPDAHAEFDAWLSKWRESVCTRPAALFLGGDQIYADDVAYSLFQSIRLLAVDAMGYDEYLPNVTYLGKPREGVAAGLVKFTVAGDKETRRPTSLDAKLTTDDGEGHLMAFGEFAAMYLLVWNPKLCDLYGLEADLTTITEHDDKNLEGFTKSVASARRVLANIPCYMSFDDHEVTDDWNADSNWVQGLENPLGRRILSNGLAAYWAFQGWGNDPVVKKGKQDFASTIESRLEKLRTSDGQAADEQFEKDLLAYGPWSYIAPTLPRVVVVDLRTNRSFFDDLDHPASLINDKGFKHLRQICAKLPVGKPLVLVLPTPLLPWEPVMIVRRNVISYRVSYGGLQDLDEYEFGDLWEDYREGRCLLLEWLRDTFDPSYVTIFSGDVHHGSVVRGTCRLQPSRDDTQEIWSLDILQVTSSPIKNEHGTLRGKYVGVPVPDIMEFLMDTKGSSYADSSDGRWLALEYDAVQLDGRLGNGTMIAQNHFCVVDFRNSRRVVADFFGAGATCSAVMPI